MTKTKKDKQKKGEMEAAEAPRNPWRENFEAIALAVTELHSYDVPEIVATDLTQLSDGYAGFLRDVLGA